MDNAALAQLLAIGFMIAVVALAFVAIPAPKSRTGSRPRAMSSDPRAWRGPFYVNADDPALFVPKRNGVGWTVNLGHPWAWRMTWIMSGSLVAAVVLRTLATR